VLRIIRLLFGYTANQTGAVPLLMLVAVIGILSFVALTSVLPFKDRLMSSLFPKDQSKAAGVPWNGVPDLPVDYSQDVWTWWYNHPFNQESPNYRPEIASPTNQVNVQTQYGGNIQAAINALPSSGGTLIFPAGTYNGNFEIIGKNNIHFIGQGTVVFNVSGESYIGGCRYSTDGKANYDGFTTGVAANNPATIACVTTGKTKNIYFNKIIFDGGNTALQAMNISASKNILFDNVTLRNFADPGTHHRGLISGNAVLENIWFRNSQFLGKERYALYLDGLHGGGVINSTVNGQFGSGGFLFLTNDDLSFDLNKNGSLDPSEKRTADHVVVAYNTYASPIYNGVAATGREVLVYKNTFQYGINAIADFDAKSSHISTSINYSYFGNRVINNSTNGLNYFAEFFTPPDCPLVTNCSKQGKYIVMGNKAQNANNFKGLVLDGIKGPGIIEGPNEVSGNCVNNASCTPVGPALPNGASPLPSITTSSAPAPSVAPSAAPSSDFPIGVFEDGNMFWGRVTDFTAMINDLQSKGLNSIMFINNTANRDEAMLSVSDQKNFNVFMSGTGNTNTFLNDTTPTIEEARAAVYPVVDAYKNHPSVKGYNVGDEPTLQQQQQTNLMVQAYKERDPNKLISPVLIGFNRGDTIYSSSNPTAFFMDAYPFNASSASCDFSMKGFGMPTYSMPQYISQLTRNKPADQPLYIILQAHSFGTPDTYNLRVPSIPELRGQHWIALGEGADGIFWFIYSSQQGWTGLKDAPTLMGEISSLAQRTNTFKQTLLNANKNTTNLFTASNGAYISTLTSKDGAKKYAVVANIGNCSSNQNITISSTQTGQLKDLETNQVYNLGDSIMFPPGNGKIFEFIGTIATPSVTPAVNLLLNDSFNTATGWTLGTNSSIDVTTSHSSGSSLKITGAAEMYTRQTPTLKPNTTYGYSYWVKTQNVTGAGFWMRYAQLSPSSLILHQTTPLSGTNDWKNVTGTFTTPANFDYGRFDLYYKLNAGDTVWIDDVMLCEGSCTAAPAPSVSGKIGDIDGNGKVDIFDYNQLLSNYGMPGASLQGDFDGNGKVDIFDYNTLLTHFGK
jgi:hypothetical protein